MENMYCLVTSTFNWLLFKCEDDVCLTYFEENWEGCQWIPVTALLDYMTQDTLTNLLKSVRTFSFEDTQAFDAKQLIHC